MTYYTKIMNKNFIEETKKTIVKNVKILLDKSKLSQAELAKCAGIPSATVNSIIQGVSDNPRMSTLISISRVFKVKISNITGEIPNSFSEQIIPMIKWEDLNFHNGNIECNITHETEYVSCLLKTKKNLFALKANTKILNLYTNNTVIIFEQSNNISDGDYVILSYNKSLPMVKKVIVDMNRYFITSDIDTINKIECTNDNTIFFGIIRETRSLYLSNPDLN